ncbi:MAG TPA: tripartite tricarboxylate transporter substrate binding protein [Burkholderiales bacterium]|nr:tripartite tricarboxylate transporter substrate binding protein [Burkholderiales bacterium]
MDEETQAAQAAARMHTVESTPITRCLIALTLAFSAVSPAQAQTGPYPDRPLRLVVPFPPGGGNDILARAVGQRLAEPLGQQVIIDNRGGAGGLIGGSIAATAAPDGYTLFLGSVGSLAHNPALRPNLPYNPTRDFAAVSLLATSPFLLAVYPGLPAKSVQELLALARAKPGALNYASAGTGSSLHMTAELFKHVTGANITHVAYKGTAPALVDLLAGQVQIILSTMPPPLPHVKSGKLRALAVTSAKRAKALPDAPTFAESGVQGFVVENWQGIVVPAKTPAAIVERLNREIIKVLALPAMIDVLNAQGLDPAGSSPAQFSQLVRSEIDRWTKLVKSAGIKVE